MEERMRKTVVEINTSDYGSTGNIMLQVADCGEKNGFSVYTVSRKWKGKQVPKHGKHFYIGSFLENGLHHFFGRLTGFEGGFTVFGTARLIRKLRKRKPDVIHLHNLHGWYINLPMLFRYIQKENIPVVWTLHDCWTFTGHCPYFDMAGCDKWKRDCRGCSLYRHYPESLTDNAEKLYRRKKKWFCGVRNMTIVTPSEWLAGLVKQSYLRDYPIRVIHNGIDLSVFKPTKSDFRAKHGIPKDCHLLLGVAFDWGPRKGVDVFAELYRRLDPAQYRIVLVGTDDATDRSLPEGILTIHRTQNQTELAEIYTAADLFVNPTREENYPTVNMEALACGTPVLTFLTGGSPEIPDETCGSVVPKDDVGAMEREIRRICAEKPYPAEACLKRARNFDRNETFMEYVRLYKNVNEQE